MTIGYSISGNNMIDDFMSMFDGEEEDKNDPRYKFNIGDVVVIENAHESYPMGRVTIVRGRRNGYPKPMFDCWAPLVYLDGIGEIGQSCCRLATKEESEKYFLGGSYDIQG